jgi:prepilin-type N-terminal cleavage/methylation domain-containing protein
MDGHIGEPEGSMSKSHLTQPPPKRSEEGFTLLEVMVAASLLLVVFYGVTQFYVRGRTQLDFEEHRRKASAVAQARLDGIRRDRRYDQLAALNNTGTDTTYVLENKNYAVHHQVVVGTPEPQATTVTVTVTWTARVAGANVNRTLVASTILARGMP